MTITNDHPASSSGSDGVADLDARRRRQRLEYLLDLRLRLAVLSSERSSHGLEDAIETWGQQMGVERTIRAEFPDVYAEYFPKWAQYDVELEHDGRVLTRECGICQSVARHAGINLDPPEAA